MNCKMTNDFQNGVHDREDIVPDLLVGVTVGAAMIVGLLISYGVLLPTLTSGDVPATGDISDVVSSKIGRAHV